jgi:hypothetical protein
MTNYQILTLNEKEQQKISSVQGHDIEPEGIEFEEFSPRMKEMPKRPEKSLGKEKEGNLGWFQIGILLFQRALPMALSYGFGGLGNFTMLYFAGHLYGDANPTVTFAGISMSMLFTNISCRSILIGMSGAVETLGNRSYQLISSLSPREPKLWSQELSRGWDCSSEVHTHLESSCDSNRCLLVLCRDDLPSTWRVASDLCGHETLPSDTCIRHPE